MARRRRRSRGSGLSFGGLTALLSLVFIAQRGWLALAVLWIFALVLWLAFLKPTQCDVEKDNGEGCGNPAHGRLRACHLVKHRRAKHDALWAMFKLRIRQSDTELSGLSPTQAMVAFLHRQRNQSQRLRGRCMTELCSRRPS